jgi:hypothetical protein
MPRYNVVDPRRQDGALLLNVQPKFCLMKITQEKREFPAKQSSGVETFFSAEQAEAEMAEKYPHGGDPYVQAED